MINMHGVFLYDETPEKYRSLFLYGVFLFSKVRVLVVNFDGFFRSCLLESSIMILTYRKDLISSYFFVFHPLSKGLPILPDIFLRKGIMEPGLACVFDCPLA